MQGKNVDGATWFRRGKDYQDQTVLKKFLDCGDDPRSWRAVKYLNAIFRRRAQTMATRADAKRNM